MTYPSKTPEFLREYHRKRRQIPHVKVMMKENARKYREKYRIGSLVRSARHRARKNGMDYDREFMESLRQLRPESCPCCGIKLDYAFSGGLGGPKNNSPSLDRVDTLKGYITENVDIICWRCNAIKRDATLSELEKIVEYMRRRLCGQ